ncbi:FecR family protein [Zobellia alginiliquefaciens]|uniref:FecR family protein n=1 Tax=Zobellia alginiliquefaciens TaxID=3032586 RepID=UPI0023E45302|nr:FecR domain-containing protein [Zobellia alginiliquefaciens]
MRYNDYLLEDFIADEYFQKWVLDSDTMCDNFWQNWLKDYPEKVKTVEKARRFVLLLNVEENQLPEQDFNAMWRNIVERRSVVLPYNKGEKRSKTNVALKVAAVFVGLMATTLAVFYTSFGASASIENHSQITLELEDGTVKVLKEGSMKILTDASGKTVGEQNQNTLYYAHSDSISHTLKYNQLTVPYGKKFQVELSDGSHVFLNSGSKLKYPVNFVSGMPRNVYLDGEAYFSVEKDSERPFTVITDDMDTRVLGTEFNVSSYKNENNTSTVLVEGSVVVFKTTNNETREPVQLVPGERAIFADDKIGVDVVNINKYIAWKDNKLLFVNDPFNLILKELERNFNVEIDNQYKALGSKEFTGTFDDESLEQILTICSEHTPFKFSIEKNKIVIQEKLDNLNF